MTKPFNAETFARLSKNEADSLVESFINDDTLVGILLNDAHLSADQRKVVEDAISNAVHDTVFRFLYALDGAASLGGVQQQYVLLDEQGNSVFSPGTLEAATSEVFDGE